MIIIKILFDSLNLIEYPLCVCVNVVVVIICPYLCFFGSTDCSEFLVLFHRHYPQFLSNTLEFLLQRLQLVSSFTGEDFFIL